ncbi:MAG: cupin domain-containing protein [Zoogloea oleivorans]|jgi:mannose-6-phosphate isomerase-like protein (cupin superfamily)|uniref:cupin domain-containing protein n=1 Tax=Zoogloea oleivorans TaxID=1552750 RepID=UPI002A371EC2|nr:cupin domain-containing protein [Zoogloea oleivorans]MDY0037432.1 cupin domain-containing protein [Zoogloea oleivorans]
MSRAKCVVTGHDFQGRARIVSAGPVPGDESFVHIPGFSAAVFWQTPAQPQVGQVSPNPLAELTSVTPEVGGTTALFVTFPPEAATPPSIEQQEAAAAEMAERLPGLAERFGDDDEPGFHRTDSIDYGVLIEGELTLHLDDGETCVLKPGDVVVQMGTRHAWRNTGSTPARMMFVMVGATRC